MADLQNYEFVVAQKLEGKWVLRRILAIVGYVLFTLVLFTVGFISRLGVPVLALVPLFLWMLIYFTWRYTRPEYEIATVSNTLRFSIIYGNRTRRQQLEFEFRQMHKIAPCDEAGMEEIKRFAPSKVWCAASSMNAPDLYYAIWQNDQKENCVFYFEATDHLLKICKYYNSAATVVTKVSR